MVINFRDIFEPLIFPVLILLIGVIGFIISTIFLIFKNLNFVSDNYKYSKNKIVIVSVITFTIVSTVIFRFSWFILITLIVLDICILIFVLGYHKKRISSTNFKTEKMSFKSKDLILMLIFLPFLIYLIKSSPFKYYGMLLALISVLISTLLFKSKHEKDLIEIQKLPKDKLIIIKEKSDYKVLIFYYFIPFIIDINFSVLYVDTSIHILVVGIYLVSFLILIHRTDRKQ